MKQGGGIGMVVLIEDLCQGMCCWLLFSLSSGIDDDEAAIEETIQPTEEDMPVLEGDEDTSRMEEVD